MRTDSLTWIDARQAHVPGSPLLENALEALAEGRLEEGLRLLIVARSDGLPDWLLHNNVAVVYMKQGFLNAAIDMLQRGLRSTGLGDKTEWRGSLEQNLGLAYARCSDYDPALQHLQEGRRIFEALKSTERVAAIERTIADMLEDQKSGLYVQPDASTPAAQSAITLSRVYSKADDGEMAESVLLEAVSSSHDKGGAEAKFVPLLLCELGAILGARGKPREAGEAFNNALELVNSFEDPSLESTVLCNLGVAKRRMGLLGEARRFLQKAKAMKETLKDETGLANVYYNLARVAQAEEELCEAKDLAEHAIDLDTKSNSDCLEYDKQLLQEIENSLQNGRSRA